MKTMRNSYPEKRDMNLAQREQPKHNSTVVAITAVCAVLVLGLVVKFGVLDVLGRVSDARDSADAAEQQLEQIQAQTDRYDEVLEEYQNYTLAASTMTGDVNPMDCLEMIQKKLVEKAHVEAYAVADGLITVQMSGVTLQQVSAIYADLMKSDYVDSVQVYTATTQENEGDAVTANMTIALHRTAQTGSQEGETNE